MKEEKEGTNRKVKVHMLPTNDSSQIHLDQTNEENPLVFSPTITSVFNALGKLHPQHLYLTSDEKIKEGWIFNSKNENVYPWVSGMIMSDYERKVIATTDPNLLEQNYKEWTKMKRVEKWLPQPSQQFIKEYCEQGGVDYVDVEYVRDMESMQLNVDTKGKESSWYLKVNTDNIITTHLIEERSTFDILTQFTSDFPLHRGVQITSIQIEDWIKDNLK